jgi:hypothetical protein
MRFVPVQDVGQQAAMVLHRVRDHLVRQRTGSINSLRGHVAEFGVVAPAQRRGLNDIMALVDGGDTSVPEAAGKSGHRALEVGARSCTSFCYPVMDLSTMALMVSGPSAAELLTASVRSTIGATLQPSLFPGGPPATCSQCRGVALTARSGTC